MNSFVADCDNCVEPHAFLVGGRNLLHWRKDAELWDGTGVINKEIAEFPFALGWFVLLQIKFKHQNKNIVLDHPYIWWSRAAKRVLVCGGKNWDLEDVSDDRCFVYDQCSNQWHHVMDLPTGRCQ